MGHGADRWDERAPDRFHSCVRSLEAPRRLNGCGHRLNASLSGGSQRSLSTYLREHIAASHAAEDLSARLIDRITGTRAFRVPQPKQKLRSFHAQDSSWPGANSRRSPKGRSSLPCVRYLALRDVPSLISRPIAALSSCMSLSKEESGTRAAVCSMRSARPSAIAFSLCWVA